MRPPTITHRPIYLPINTHKSLNDKLTKLGIPIIQTAPQTIKHLTNISKRINSVTTSDTGIYSISCKDCDKHYIVETQRNLEKDSTNTNDQLG